MKEQEWSDYKKKKKTYSLACTSASLQYKKAGTIFLLRYGGQ